MRHLACLLAVAAVAAGDTAKELRKALVLAITKNAGLPDVVPLLSDEAVDLLAADPSCAREVCFVAAQYVYRARSARAQWEPLVGRVCAIGHRAMDRAPEDADAVQACAEAELCRLRFACAFGLETRSEEWGSVADLLLKSHGKEPGEGAKMERAAEILCEGAGARGADAAALGARAEKVCEEGLEKYPASPFFRRMVFDRRLARIEAQLVSDRRGAQKALTDYLAELRAQAEGKGGDRIASTAYTDAVTVARATKGLGVKADYVTRHLTVAANNLQLDIPVSDHWRYEDGSILQYGRRGELLRSISFDTFSWDTNYYIGQSQFGGDNLKGLAQLDEMNAEETVVKITKRRKPARRRLNPRFPSAVHFEVSGYDSEGDFLRWSNYYVKTEKRVSAQVSILEFGDLKEDPEVEFVIGSVRETK